MATTAFFLGYMASAVTLIAGGAWLALQHQACMGWFVAGVGALMLLNIHTRPNETTGEAADE